MTFDEARIEIVKAIRHIYEQDEGSNIAELLIENITKLARSERILRRNDPLAIPQQESLHSAIVRLRDHEPIQYVINEAWFAGMRFYVDKNVLIPRPETEELVEWVVSDCKSAIGNRQLANPKFLDIGTGSGCIAVALKNKLQDVEMWACDVSDEALNVARINADALRAAIDFVPMNFLDPDQRKQLPRADVMVSNPPYIPQNEKTRMKENVVNYEPIAALFVPDNDPLIFYKAIAEFGRAKLNKRGAIYVEIHETLGQSVKDLFLSAGFQTVDLKRDLQGKDRMIKATS
jgi:release factor glutamine methyltransferase